jgi:hypothetical protein
MIPATAAARGVRSGLPASNTSWRIGPPVVAPQVRRPRPGSAVSPRRPRAAWRLRAAVPLLVRCPRRSRMRRSWCRAGPMPTAPARGSLLKVTSKLLSVYHRVDGWDVRVVECRTLSMRLRVLHRRGLHAEILRPAWSFFLHVRGPAVARRERRRSGGGGDADTRSQFPSGRRAHRRPRWWPSGQHGALAADSIPWVLVAGRDHADQRQCGRSGPVCHLLDHPVLGWSR